MNIFLIITFVLGLLISVPPIQQNTLTDQQLDFLNTTTAISEWKASQSITDGCSSPGPIHWFANTFLPSYQWDVCCFEHDAFYGYGYKYGITKDQADYDLWSCVNDSGHYFVANIVYDGVRIGGSKHYNKGEK